MHAEGVAQPGNDIKVHQEVREDDPSVCRYPGYALKRVSLGVTRYLLPLTNTNFAESADSRYVRKVEKSSAFMDQSH